MRNLKVAALQTRPEFGRVADNIHQALQMVPADCDLAVLPELFATGYQFRSRGEAWDYAEVLVSQPVGQPIGQAAADQAAPAGRGPICAKLTEFARDRDVTLVAGLAERDGDRLYNSAVLIRPDGTRERYRKVHLFDQEKLIFTPGDLGFPVFPACGTTVGLMICFDWIFPEAARSLALQGAQILCHPSNLLLPWCPEAMVTRCQENRVFALTSNRVGSENRTGVRLDFIGMSEVVSPLGALLARLDRQQTGAAEAVIDLDEIRKQVTPLNHIHGDRRPDQYRL